MLIWTSIQKLKQKSNFLLNSGPSPFFNSCSKFSSKKRIHHTFQIRGEDTLDAEKTNKVP